MVKLSVDGLENVAIVREYHCRRFRDKMIKYHMERITPRHARYELLGFLGDGPMTTDYRATFRAFRINC